ncbi:MAG: ATP synthase F1 subunit delta [Firmicutes bacterium]|nr:ATP synthase F1 subunit delta [Bacillota bacterium]
MINQISVTGLPDEHGLSKRYTHALFAIAEEQGLTEEFLTQLTEIDAVLAADNGCLSELLSNGRMPLSKQKSLIEEIFAQRIHPLLLNLVYLLLDKGRGGYLPAVLPAYQQLLDEKAGVLPVIAIGPYAMPAEQANSLTEAVAKLCGKQIRLQQKVEADLIGGLKLIIDGTVYDGSLKRQLDILEHRLKYS